MNKLIKVVNPDVVEKLAASGFFYISKEKINNKDVYVFDGSPELMKHLQNNFSNSFYCENKLRF